jgi:tetratricopeptide (TPR) repeat protein
VVQSVIQGVLEAGKRFFALSGAVIVLAAAPLVALGQEGERLIDQPPFDRITLDQANQNAVLDVQTLDLPERKVPEAPKPGSVLLVRLLSEPGEDYEVAWRHIAKVELFEQLVLREANQLVAQQRFDEAYDYFQYMLNRFPELDGLAPSLQAYLYADAGRLFQQRKFDQALIVVEELYRRNKAFRSGAVPEVLGRIADKLIDEAVEEDRYAAARMMLERLVNDYGAEQQPLIAKWRNGLSQLAAGRRDEAKGHLDAGRFREAHLAGKAMSVIYPDVPGGRELLAEIERQYPLFVVGVMMPSLDSGDPRSLDNWAARRVGRLARRDLFEFNGYTPEGGDYKFSLGKFERGNNGRRLILSVAPPNPVTAAGASGAGAAAATTGPSGYVSGYASGYEVARRLVELADPDSPERIPSWMRLFKSVQIEDAFRVSVDLRSPFVMPEAILHAPLLSPALTEGPEAAGLEYVAAERSEVETRFTYNPHRAPPPGPRPPEVIERPFAEAADAIAALERGEIDAIDRLFPADALRLPGEGRVNVGAYALPTLHFLIPNREKPYLKNLTFRRALLYAINRQAILSQGLLGGAQAPGFNVISGPFPTGVTSDDPIGYANDETRPPWPYDPRLAFVLAKLAENEVNDAAARKRQGPPERKPLVICRPATEAARIACAAIVKQLEIVQIKSQVVDLPPGQTKPQGDWDLLYVEMQIFEPLVDAQRLMGEGGLAFIDTPYVRQILRNLELATNWSRARRLLQQLHATIHEDFSLLPLYQTTESFAYRRQLSGLSEKPAWLYENLADWRTARGGQ